MKVSKIQKDREIQRIDVLDINIKIWRRMYRKIKRRKRLIGRLKKKQKGRYIFRNKEKERVIVE